MPQTPEPDDLAARAPGAAVNLHEMTPAELQAAQDRALNSITAAVFAFCTFPGPVEVKRVKESMWAYQIAWMQGRERPHEPLKVGDHVRRNDWGYYGRITAIAAGGAQAITTSNPNLVSMKHLSRWVGPIP